MAAGYLSALSQSAVGVRSAGSAPADQPNPMAVEAMAEEGIDIRDNRPTILTTEDVRASDVVSPWAAAMPARSSRASVTRIGPWKTRQARISSPCAGSATRSANVSRCCCTSCSPQRCRHERDERDRSRGSAALS
ncbi:low molecular weight phosphatase family protein [Bogoriella caseilytica]|uniref:arsenate-mycothiol transferase ArsC n=1 Tax=Bogoriella caseilytica TaxID=56055 RepID=UPI003CCC718A